MIKRDKDETSYMQQWGKRPDQVDCLNCRGDEAGIITVKICPECEKTGLDPIPWSELFMDGRKMEKWGGK